VPSHQDDARRHAGKAQQIISIYPGAIHNPAMPIQIQNFAILLETAFASQGPQSVNLLSWTNPGPDCQHWEANGDCR
jgi:hypothetical protein